MKIKRFMETCYKCEVKVKETKVVKDGVELYCLKCPKCGEEYFTSSELLKYDILKGNRKMIRKFGVLGSSSIIRIPDKVMKKYKINSGDFGYFRETPEGFLIKPVSRKEIKNK